MKRILQRLPPHFRNTLVYLVTIFVTQLASFVLLPIVTRFLEPAEYGVYAIALALANLIGMFGSSWIRNVGFRFYYDAKDSGTTRAFYWSLAVLQVALLTLVFAVTAGVFVLMDEPVVPLRTLLAAATMVLASDFLALTVAFVRAEQLSGRFALAETTSAIVRIGGTTAGLYLGFANAEFLFLAAATAAGLGGLIAAVSLQSSLEGGFAIDGPSLLRVTARAPGALPFSVGEWIHNLADRLILDLFAARAVVGIYSAGYALGDRLVGGIVMAVFMMAWPDVLSSWRDGGLDRARDAVERYIQIYLWLTVGPLVALSLFGGTIVQLLGDDYREAVRILPLVATAAWVKGFGNCFNRHFELTKRFWALSAITLFGAAVNIGLNFLLVPTMMATGAALATLVAQVLIAFVFIVSRDRRLVSFPTADLGYVVLAVVVAGAATVPLLGLSFWSLAGFAVLYAAALGAVWWRRFRGR